MSPIRESEQHRYPADWDEISRRIRLYRADGWCECDGRCGHDHTDDPESRTTRCSAINGHPHPVTGSRVVLTVAHLNHIPEDCRDENLMAMCQRCHLAYDREHHAETRAARRAGGPPLPFEPVS